MQKKSYLCSMIRFTIITCIYNAEMELERTLNSVRQQNYHELQHIIIDGASRDGTMQIVRKYDDIVRKNNLYDVLVVSERDKGLYDAMNKGLKLADGDYVVYLNAGDTFHEASTLSDISNSICGISPLPGVVYGETNIVDASGRFKRHRRLQTPERLTWKSFKDGMLVCHQSFYALRDIAQQNPYNQRYRYSADVDWCIRIMRQAQQRGLSLYNTHLILCDYLEGGMSIKNHRKSLQERFRIMACHYGLLATIVQHVRFLIRLRKK